MVRDKPSELIFMDELKVCETSNEGADLHNQVCSVRSNCKRLRYCVINRGREYVSVLS